MKKITELTNEYKQRIFPTLEDSSTFELNIFYSPQQEQWFFDFTYKSLVIKGMKMVLSSNILGQWSNILPFGLSCTALDSNIDPFLLNDFSTNRCELFILTQEELSELNTLING